MLSRPARAAGAAACASALLLPVPTPAQALIGADRDEVLDPVVAMTDRAHARAAKANVRLHRANARLRDATADADRRRELRDWSIRHLRARNGELRERNRELRRAARREARRARRAAAAAPAVAVPAHLQAIAACESGGDPGAVGGGGAYRGKYQFDQGTWASVGGTGDPAAAPEAEQDRRAAMLYARAGSSPWPVCGG